MISPFSFFQKFYAHYLKACGHDQWRKGDYAKAELLFQRALKIKKKVLGPEHPNTGDSLNNLELFYFATGRESGAEDRENREAERMKSAEQRIVRRSKCGGLSL
jgi:tetratricopeptide (TPR) repeat protein